MAAGGVCQLSTSATPAAALQSSMTSTNRNSGISSSGASSVTAEATMGGTLSPSAIISDHLPLSTMSQMATSTPTTKSGSGTYSLTLDYTYFFFSTDVVNYDFTKLDSFTLKYHDGEISEIASLNAENAQDLVDFLTTSCPNLKRLCLQPAVFWDEDAVDIMAKYFATAASSSNLASIDIGLCLPTEKVRPFARWGTEERLLRAICNNNLSGGDGSNSKPSLVELRLGGFSFQKPGTMDPLAEMIADNRLQSLELWKCFLYFPNVAFFNAIRSTKSLTSLLIDHDTLVEFSSCDGTPQVMVNEHLEVWRDLLRAFASNSGSVKSLAVLSGCMSDISAMDLVRMLPKLGQLRELYVDLKWPVLSRWSSCADSSTTATSATKKTARLPTTVQSNMIRLLDDQETILTMLESHCMELETLVLHTTTANIDPEERGFQEMITYYCDLNASGRRILNSTKCVPLGVWPLIFERINLQTHGHKVDAIFQMLATGPCLRQNQKTATMPQYCPEDPPSLPLPQHNISPLPNDINTKKQRLM